ncbi:MAG: hypothetical protein ACYTBJ_15065 [Planctomycetota bacterium]|jgi:hypothetical protein
MPIDRVYLRNRYANKKIDTERQCILDLLDELDAAHEEIAQYRETLGMDKKWIDDGNDPEPMF